jgi:hypothetical protein
MTGLGVAAEPARQLSGAVDLVGIGSIYTRAVQASDSTVLKTNAYLARLYDRTLCRSMFGVVFDDLRIDARCVFEEGMLGRQNLGTKGTSMPVRIDRRHAAYLVEANAIHRGMRWCVRSPSRSAAVTWLR